MAKRRRFKCGECDRLFSMAAHLARHMNTTHASKKAKAAKTKRRAVGKKKGVLVATRAKRGAGSDLAGLLASLRAHRDRLADQRNETDNQMQAIDAALAALGESSSTAPRADARRKWGKGPRAGSLKDYVARVLRGLVNGKRVKDIAAAVKKAGYKSKSKTLDHAVSKALADMKNVAKAGRGVYRLK